MLGLGGHGRRQKFSKRHSRGQRLGGCLRRTEKAHSHKHGCFREWRCLLQVLPRAVVRLATYLVCNMVWALSSAHRKRLIEWISQQHGRHPYFHPQVPDKKTGLLEGIICLQSLSREDSGSGDRIAQSLLWGLVVDGLGIGKQTLCVISSVLTQIESQEYVKWFYLSPYLVSLEINIESTIHESTHGDDDDNVL